MIQARLMGYTFTELGVAHLPRVDGISTAARPSIIFKTIWEIIQFRKAYKKQLSAGRQ